MTPLNPLPFVGFTLTLPDNATVVEADPAPYNNTNELILYNTDTTNRIFMQIQKVDSGPLPAAGTIVESNSTIIPAGGSLSLCIGMEGDRVPLGTTAFWLANPGQGFNILFLAESGTNVELNITYVQGMGGATGSGSC